MGRISPGPTRWPPGAERRLVPAKSNLKPQTVTNPTARALASWLSALWGRHEGARGGRLLPGGGGRGSGALPPPTVSLERRMEGLPEKPKVQLRMGNRESHRLVSKIRKDALLELRCNLEVELYGNTVNAVEGLYCTMKNSCYQ